MVNSLLTEALIARYLNKRVQGFKDLQTAEAVSQRMVNDLSGLCHGLEEELRADMHRIGDAAHEISSNLARYDLDTAVYALE